MSVLHLILDIADIVIMVLFFVAFMSYFDIFDLFDFISSRRRYLKRRKEVKSYEENEKNP